MIFTFKNNNFLGISMFTVTTLILFAASCSTSQKTTDTEEITFSTPKNFDKNEYYNPEKINRSDDKSLNFSQAKLENGIRSLFEYLEYPKQARDQKIMGRVVSRVYLNEKGEVDEIEIIESPHKTLSEAAMKAILQVSFLPATLNGQSVKSIYIAPTSFRLNNF